MDRFWDDSVIFFYGKRYSFSWKHLGWAGKGKIFFLKIEDGSEEGKTFLQKDCGWI